MLAGRTLDLTLFAATQAVDVIVGEVWSRHRARRTAAQSWTKVRLILCFAPISHSTCQGQAQD